MGMEILINDHGVSVKKQRRLVDPDTGDEVEGTPHRTAVGLLNYVPRDEAGEPDLSDQTAVDAAKDQARAEIIGLIEGVVGTDFADLTGRIKAAEDERDLVRQKLTAAEERAAAAEAQVAELKERLNK